METGKVRVQLSSGLISSENTVYIPKEKLGCLHSFLKKEVFEDRASNDFIRNLMNAEKLSFRRENGH